MRTRSINSIKDFCADPARCMWLMLAISLLAHAAFLVQWPGRKNLSSQIILDSQKSDITLINFTQMQLKWDEVEPVVKIKPDAGEIPSLFKKKERKVIQREKETQPAVVSLSAEGQVAKDTYETRVLKRIHRMKYYPQFAKRMGKEGIVGLRFTVNRDGALKSSVEIIRGCGHEILNDAGITTIKNANPFPSFPEDLAKHRDEMIFIVNIEYSLKLD